MKFEFEHDKLHERAVATSREYLRREAELIGILQEVDLRKTYLRYQAPSLFVYATKLLGLSPDVAYALINIARKAVAVPELKAAIEERKITVSNARRIAPILTLENKDVWIEKAASLSKDRLERELAAAHPERALPTRMKARSEMHARLEIDLPHAVIEKLKRAQDVLSQKKKNSVDSAEALEAALDLFLERQDPVQKAKRAEKRSATPPTKKDKLGLGQVVTTPVFSEEYIAMARKMGFGHLILKRTPIPAANKHQIALRDRTQCAHVYSDGSRCESRRWTESHHIKPIASGGLNHAENLITLCFQHHRLLHSELRLG